jgi:hypothetical protein
MREVSEDTPIVTAMEAVPDAGAQPENSPESTLNLLPYPVTFVSRYAGQWPELFGAPRGPLPDPENLVEGPINTENNCVRTYLYLKRLNYNVSISDRMVPGEICVIATREWGVPAYMSGAFVVACRADYADPVLCDFTVVQNECNVQSTSQIFIPLWTQPNLIPRDDERGSRVETIVYKGLKRNIYHLFYSEEFAGRLAEVGVRLVMNFEDEVNLWNDYRAMDLFLAVRDMTEADALIKPPTKLVTAWKAGVPALVGPEPAFLRLKRCDLDLIEVRTPEEAFTAILRLKENPELYRQMVINGRRRAADFTVDQITKRWLEVLKGPVAEQYELWRNRSAVSRFLRRVVKFPQYKLAKIRYVNNIHHGYRPISRRFT